jgi:amino acid transporter
MLANIALVKYFWKDSERSLLRHVIIPLAGIAALAYPLYFVAKPGQAHPYSLVPYVVLAWIVLGFLAYFYLRSQGPDKLEAVGRAIAEEEDDLAEGHLVSAPV